MCVYNVSLNPNRYSLNWISVAIYQRENLPLGTTDNINLRTDKIKLKFLKKISIKLLGVTLWELVKFKNCESSQEESTVG